MFFLKAICHKSLLTLILHIIWTGCHAYPIVEHTKQYFHWINGNIVIVLNSPLNLSLSLFSLAIITIFSANLVNPDMTVEHHCVGNSDLHSYVTRPCEHVLHSIFSKLINGIQCICTDIRHYSFVSFCDFNTLFLLRPYWCAVGARINRAGVLKLFQSLDPFTNHAIFADPWCDLICQSKL